MGKFFTEENAGVDTHDAKPVPKKKKFFTDANSGEVKPAETRGEEPKPRTFLDDAGKFGMDVMRNFNDTLTFGGYPALLEMLGADPNAYEDLENSDPFAGVIGDTLGYIVPGSAASKAVGTVVKPLARNTIPAVIGREGAANAAVSAVDNVARTGTIDPVDIAIDAAIGAGAGGVLSGAVTLGGRAVSTGARVRGMGNELTLGDKQAAEGFSRYAGDKGITLNNAEAAYAVAPERAATVTAGLDRAATAPKGNAVLDSFNETRKKSLIETGSRVVDDIGGGISPMDASNAAQNAVVRNKKMVQQSAEPYYREAETKKLPPTWVPKDGYTGEAVKEVLDDPGIMKGLTLTSATPAVPKGIPPSTNSVLFLDAVKKKLDTNAAQAFGREDAQVGTFARDEANALTEKLDQIAPTYPVARDIAEQGRGMVQGLEAGPLGSVAKSPTTAGQGKALFGAGNEVEREAASIAARNMPPEVPLGILGNVLDTATNKSGAGWGKGALPTPIAKQLADEALARAGKGEISPILDAARAVDPKLPNSFAHEHTGPWGEGWAAIRDFGAEGVAKKMTDPAWLKKMGKMGPLQAAITRAVDATSQTARQRSRAPKKKKRD